MSKLSLERVTSSFGFQAAFNNILSKIESEFADKVLYRDNPVGTTNEMKNDLDMGTHDVLNVKMVDAQQFRVGGVDLDDVVNQLIDDLATIPAETMGYRDEAIAARNAAQLAESGAQASEDAAQASALTASTKASEASASASQAAVSASIAFAEKQLALLFSGNASQSATDALGHANDAAASATQASASESVAAASALAADASADAAAISEANAASSASAANLSALDADSSEAAALQYKNDIIDLFADYTLDGLHTHTNKTVLDGTQESFTTALKTKLDGIEAGAQVNANITKAEIEAKLTGEISTHSHVGDGIHADSITNVLLANMAVSTIKGRATAGTGDPEDLTASQVRTILNVADGANAYFHPNHSGDVTSVADGATTIAANAVTNTKAADMAVNTIKGRITAGTGDPEDLTATQVRTILNVADGAEVNQNTFSNIAVSGQTTVSADSKTDTLTLIAGSNVTLTTDAANDTVTISSTGYTEPTLSPGSTIYAQDDVEIIKGVAANTYPAALPARSSDMAIDRWVTAAGNLAAMRVDHAGSLTVSIDLDRDDSDQSYARLVVNTTQIVEWAVTTSYTTKTQNITVAKGDIVAIQGRDVSLDSEVKIRNFRLLVATLP